MHCGYLKLYREEPKEKYVFLCILKAHRQFSVPIFLSNSLCYKLSTNILHVSCSNGLMIPEGTAADRLSFLQHYKILTHHSVFNDIKNINNTRSEEKG